MVADARIAIFVVCVLFPYHLQTFSFHLQIWRSKPGAGQQEVPVYPLEHQFGYMVHLRVFQQTHGANGREGIFADNRFGGVVEIDNVGFPEARFDKSEGVPVGTGMLRITIDIGQDILMQDIGLEVGHGPGLGRRYVGSIS